jgi:putative endonuclease
MPSEKRKFGDVCENLAVKCLTGRSFRLLERNYLKKWGEIDIIALDSVSRETPGIHFIEVKGNRYNSLHPHTHKPEDNVHMWKTRRLWRAIQTWFMEHPDYEDYEWQNDVMAVFIDEEHKRFKIRWTKNVIIG